MTTNLSRVRGSLTTSLGFNIATPFSTCFRSPPIPNLPSRNFCLHWRRYRRVRGGSTPSSRSCSDERENRASHVGNLLACCRSPRPIRVRKVSTSGTKGMGAGISGSFGSESLCAHLACARRPGADVIGVATQARDRSPKADGTRKDFIRAVGGEICQFVTGSPSKWHDLDFGSLGLLRV